MATLEERKLVARIQAGERKAFEELLDAYEVRVYRLALHFTGNVSDAEDVTQEIFLGVYKGLVRFRGESALGTWVYRIAMNHCLEYRRKRRLDMSQIDTELNIQSEDWRDDPLRAAGHQELSDKLQAAIGCLSPLHREVVALHELQGLTYQEVAETLDVPVGTVKSRLSNAFRRLRALLGTYVYEGSPTS